MDIKVLYQNLLDELQSFGYKDISSNDHYISYTDFKWVVGFKLKIRKSFHNKILRELEDLGMIEKLSQRTIKINTSEYFKKNKENIS